MLTGSTTAVHKENKLTFDGRLGDVYLQLWIKNRFLCTPSKAIHNSLPRPHRFFGHLPAPAIDAKRRSIKAVPKSQGLGSPMLTRFIHHTSMILFGVE